MAQSKTFPKINVKALNIDGKVETLEHIFDHMHSRAQGQAQSSYLLGGDTGVGKTSFIRDLSALLGLELVLIETPHIVEEHIIDIPFIVIKPNGQRSSSRVDVDSKGSQQQFDIEFAKSHLFSTLESAQKISDSALLANLKRRPDLMLIWEKLGGTETSIPQEIKDLRLKFKVILFLDEYFRQTSTSIRNMLRSILNGRLGTKELPKSIYTIFASNLVDQGVGDILENEDFTLLNFDTPSLDEWFAYLVTKYKNTKTPMDEELVGRFYELMKKNKGSLSLNDVAADVRVSPRRWEQLMVYINNSLPVKNAEDAALLLKNVEINFRHYQTGDQAAIAKDVVNTVKEMIKERQNIDASPDNVDTSDWREVLKHQIETRIKSGSDRKYVPVIGGPPGAGKTQFINNIGTDLDLVTVVVDVQNLAPEDVIGTPVSKSSQGGQIEVSFSRPPLWDQINSQMKEGEQHLLERLKKFSKDAAEAKEKYEAWKKADVKYLIFFDEFNRANPKVFNAIRKVILEKEFNPEYKLPEESVLVAAINPTGKGTQELTKHVRDVFDVIPVGVSWQKFKKHLDTVDLDVSPEISGVARSALNAFVDQFKVKATKQIDNVDPHFYLSVGPHPMYVSGREYTDLLVGLARATQREYSKQIANMDDKDFDANKAEMSIRTAMARRIGHTLGAVITKHGVDAPEFVNDLEEWIKYTDKISFGNMFKKQVESIKPLKDILDKAFKDPKNPDLFDDAEFFSYIESVDANDFQEQLKEYLTDTIFADVKNVLNKNRKKKILDPVAKKTEIVQDISGDITNLEYIIREIIHAIKVHDVTNKMVDVLKTVYRDLVSAVTNEADKHGIDMTNVIKVNKALSAAIK